MIRVRSAAGSLLAAGATVLATAGAATADGAPPPSAAYAGGVVVSNGDTAVVRVAYTCTTDLTPGNHLFVALKQGPDVNPDNFSSKATQLTSYLNTNWSPDAGPNALTCDGERHVQKVVLKTAPGFDGGPVTGGAAAVQICVFDNITGVNELHEPIGGYAGGVTMQRVVINHSPDFAS